MSLPPAVWAVVLVISTVCFVREVRFYRRERRSRNAALDRLASYYRGGGQFGEPAERALWAQLAEANRRSERRS